MRLCGYDGHILLGNWSGPAVQRTLMAMLGLEVVGQGFRYMMFLPFHWLAFCWLSAVESTLHDTTSV